MQAQSTYTRELFSITQVVAKFGHYLIGNKFVIKSDQQALNQLGTEVIQTPEQQKWLPKLLGFDFTIEYKPGPENQATDALSRYFPLAYYSSSHCSLLDQIRVQQLLDPQLASIIQTL